MASIYLHNHKDFPDLLRIIDEEQGIEAGLVEKDYWIMHALYGLKQQRYNFQLKGGTSLSKGFGLIHRFSEDYNLSRYFKVPVKAISSDPPDITLFRNALSKFGDKKFYKKEIDPSESFSSLQISGLQVDSLMQGIIQFMHQRMVNELKNFIEYNQHFGKFLYLQEIFPETQYIIQSAVRTKHTLEPGLQDLRE